jgi:hypothetical protein
VEEYPADIIHSAEDCGGGLIVDIRCDGPALNTGDQRRLHVLRRNSLEGSLDAIKTTWWPYETG